VPWGLFSHGAPSNDGYRPGIRPTGGAAAAQPGLVGRLHKRCPVSRFRLFNVNDDFNRESVTIEVDTSLRSERLGRVFERIEAEHGLPDMLRVDNGPEFMGQVFVDWCQANGVLIDYITVPGPAQSPYRNRLTNDVLAHPNLI